MRRTSALILSLILLTLVACDRDAVRVDSDSVARAGSIQLGVEEAAQLLAPVQGLPNDTPVVQALADFWVDYTLLALAMNREGELDRVDLASILRQEENQELVMRLRDEVIQVDEEISDEQLAEFYATERPGEQVRARHILVLFPEQSTPQDRDSVQALAEELRDRARAGEDFSQLAETYSDDTGSAQRGGDLNWFSRGTMVPPFEEAAFALEPGEVSDVVESQYGLHVIKLDDRDFPALDDIREQLRFDLQMDRTSQAESIFVAGIEDAASVRIQDDAVEAMREIAEDPSVELSSRQAGQALASFEGGAYTRGQFREFIVSQPPQFRDQVLMAEDEQLDMFLQNLTRSELLVVEARRRGITVDESEMEELRREIREQYREIAGFLEIDAISPAEGETLDAAVRREMLDLLGRIVTGEVDIFPLESLAIPLRSHFGARISETGVERVVERVAAIRDEDPDTQEFDMGELQDLLDDAEVPEGAGDPGSPEGDG